MTTEVYIGMSNGLLAFTPDPGPQRNPRRAVELSFPFPVPIVMYTGTDDIP